MSLGTQTQGEDEKGTLDDTAADVIPRDVRHSPIPHYADSPDPKTRTTAVPDVP